MWYNGHNETLLVAGLNFPTSPQSNRRLSIMTDSIIKIPLSKTGKYAGMYEAIVDSIDADLAELNWAYHKGRNTNYAKRYFKIDDEFKFKLLHRLIMERILNKSIPDGMFVDHINHDGLDNRRENLRLATPSQNNSNSLKRRKTSSKYKCVSWDKDRNKWESYIVVKGKKHHIGYFDNDKDAHDAYFEKAKEVYGEFANDGFIDKGE